MNGQERRSKYDGIINMQHHTSQKHPRMSMTDRAAQFSPFAALTGYDAAIRETARQTDRRIELDEYERERLDGQLQMIRSCMGEKPEIKVTFFVPDGRKAGGEYRIAVGRLGKIRDHEGVLILEGGERIPIKEIMKLEFHDTGQ